MIKYTYILFFLSIYSLLAVDNIDSLEKVLQTQNDIEKLSTLDKLSRTYSAISNEKRLQYSLEYLHLAESLDNDTAKANANMAMGISFYYSSNIDSAEVYLLNAKDYYSLIKDTVRVAACINNLGVIFHQTGRFKKSIEYYYKSMRIKEESKDTLGMAKTFNNIGSIYFDWKKFDKSLDFFKKAKKYYFLMNDSLTYGLIYRNFGTVYFEKAAEYITDSTNNKYLDSPNSILINSNFAITDFYNINDSTKKYFDLSLKNFQKALEFYNKFNNQDGIAHIKNSLGIIKRYNREYDDAMQLHNEAIATFREKQNISGLAKALTNKGITLFLMGETKKSIETLEEGLQAANKVKNINIAADAYRGLTVAYKNIGNYQKALDNSLKLMDTKDSLFNKANLRMLEELEMEYQTDKRDAELELAVKNEEVLRQQIIILIISIASVLIIAIGLFYRNRFKTKTNKLLVKNNEELTDLNHKLKITELDLREAINTKDRFFSIIAHDLRNPLGLFISIVKLLKKEHDEMSNEEIHEIIDGLDQSADKVYLLLENLLTWSRSQRGKIEYNPSEENLQSLVQKSIEPILMVSNEKNIELLNKVDPKIMVYVDVNITNTVIRNLVSNAIKFSKENSIIEIESIKLIDKIKVSIKDHGIGMSKDTKENLFKVDKNISHDGTKGEKGTGLGLIISKEFVEMQDGDIFVESEVGKGSIFSFTLNKAGNNG